MTLTPFLTADPIVQVHAGTAILALLLGPFVIWRKRRDLAHRIMGRVWIVTMIIVASSSWFINSFGWIGPFGPVHIFAIMTYWSLYQSIRHLIARRYAEHGAEMRSLYIYALGIAGAFTFLPGRVMHRMAFEGAGFGPVAIIAVLVLGLAIYERQGGPLKIVR
jgi:uncharacterized membrane protein